jgi:general secretion pathway protein K
MNDERGIALVLVLWVLMLLFIIVFEFCSTMRIEATITRNFKEGERSYYFAQAGINRAIIELVKTKSDVKKFKGSKESLVDKEDRRESDKDEDEEEEELEEWVPREQPYAFLFEDGECEVTIGDEGSKINLNWIAARAKSDRQVLADIIERSCGLYDVERDTIVDSIIDWVDKDHERLMNGAEDDYYESLEDPYECRDGEFVILDELLLVRGVTEDIYYGRFNPENDDEEETSRTVRPRRRSSFATSMTDNDKMPTGVYQGLSELFTVFSTGNALKLNINDAPFGLLMSLPAMTEDIAYDIIRMRREEEFEDVRDSRLLELPIYDQIASQLTVEPTNFYRITARGRIANSSVARSISAVVEIAPRTKDNYTILYWQEGV